jgi:DNA modification methylase
MPATVLDPFLGAGTTALVADQLGRHCIGIELSYQYATMARNRIANDAGMFAQIAAE